MIVFICLVGYLFKTFAVGFEIVLDMETGLWAWLKKKKNELPDYLLRIHYSFQGVEQIFWFLLLVDVGLLLRLSLASHMSTEDLEYKSLGQ